MQPKIHLLNAGKAGCRKERKQEGRKRLEWIFFFWGGGAIK
jgi:hypothetical protein